MELGSGRAREELAPTSIPVTRWICGWLRVMGIEEGHGGALVGGLDRDEIPRNTVAAAERDRWDMSLDFRVGLFKLVGGLEGDPPIRSDGREK